jgi:HlyD family secretion protein
MKNRLIFTISFVGILAGIVTAYVFGIKTPPLPPVFDPASNPYVSGINAEGGVDPEFETTS